MEEIYFETLVRKKVDVAPSHLNMGVDTYILSYLKNLCENRCITEGFVKEGSVQIVKRGVGRIYGSHFTGDTRFEVEFSAMICNPVPGNIYEMVVSSITKVDLQGKVGPMNVIVNKQFHSDPVELSAIDRAKVGDTVKIEVIGKRFFPNGKEIRVGAKIVVDSVLAKKEKERRSGSKKPQMVTTTGDLDEDDVSEKAQNAEDVEEESEDEKEKEVGEEDGEEDVELSDESEYEEEEEEVPQGFKVQDPAKVGQEEVVESDVEDEDEEEGGSDVEDE